MKDHGKKKGWTYTPPKKEAMKKRAESRGGDFDTLLIDGVQSFGPKEGNYRIRYLPATWEDPQHFGFDVWVHYAVGADEQSYVCLLKMKGEPCPICEACAADTSGDLARVSARKRVGAWVIDRKNTDVGPQLWLQPWTFDKEMASQAQTEEGEALSVDNPKEGYDLLFTRTGTGLATKYTGLKFSRIASPLADEVETYKKWMRVAIGTPVPEALNYYDYDHIAAAFNGAAPSKTKSKPKADEDDDMPETRKGATKVKDAEEEPKKTKKVKSDKAKPAKAIDLDDLDL